MLTLNREELAWAGGFYTGEGWTGSTVINKTKANPDRHVRMAVSQVERAPLERFRNAVQLGKIRGPYPAGKGARPISQWIVGSFEETQAAIAMLWPWLSPVKQEQARIVLRTYGEYRRTKKQRNYIPLNISKRHEQMRQMHSSGMSTKEIAKRTFASQETVCAAIRKASPAVPQEIS